ncbi:MAG: hypothetical protein JWM05_3324 [Acidimicrobiales bacterium]|nr:hypothetical protein [Acidimicrobiales bacterium]
MTVVVVVEGVVIALLALLVVGLLRSHAEILRRLHQLGAGLEPDEAPAPPPGGPRPGRDFQVMPQVPSPPDREAFGGVADIAGAGVDDDAVTVRVTGVEHDTIVAFLSAGCLTCQRFWDAFRKPKKLGLPAGVRLVVVTKGRHEESPTAIGRLAPPGIPLVMSSDAWVDYDVPGSPYFVLVHGPSGRVRGEGTGPDWEQVSSLLNQASGDSAADADLAGRRVRKPVSDAEREARVDRELLAAGVRPGDPSLYEATDPADHDEGDHDHDHAAGHDGHDHPEAASS